MVNKFYADIGGQGISSVTEGEGKRTGGTVRSRGWVSPRRPPEGNMPALGVARGPWPSSFRKLNSSKDGSVGNGGGEGCHCPTWKSQE